MFGWKRSTSNASDKEADNVSDKQSASTNQTSSASSSKRAWKVDKDQPTCSSPFAQPSENSDEKPRLQDIETDEQRAKYEKVLKYFQDPELSLPITEKSPKKEDNKPLNKHEKSWLTKQCILRYLRACSWNANECITRLSSSITWRREFGIAGGEYEKLTESVVSAENGTGKQMVLGFDHGSRPCLFLMSGRQNTKPSFTQIQHLIYMLERCIDYMPQGQDKLALCVDFKTYPEVIMKGANIPSVTVGKQVLHILQYHYPERLGRALFINIPLLVWGFLKICYPFVDPYTKQKIAMDTPFTEFIPNEQLSVNYGGDLNFEYNHEVYWPEFIKIANEKREAYLKKFEELGGHVGLDEYELRAM